MGGIAHLAISRRAPQTRAAHGFAAVGVAADQREHRICSFCAHTHARTAHHACAHALRKSAHLRWSVRRRRHTHGAVFPCDVATPSLICAFSGRARVAASDAHLSKRRTAASAATSAWRRITLPLRHRSSPCELINGAVRAHSACCSRHLHQDAIQTGGSGGGRICSPLARSVRQQASAGKTLGRQAWTDWALRTALFAHVLHVSQIRW